MDFFSLFWEKGNEGDRVREKWERDLSLRQLTWSLSQMILFIRDRTDTDSQTQTTDTLMLLFVVCYYHYSSSTKCWIFSISCIIKQKHWAYTRPIHRPVLLSELLSSSHRKILDPSARLNHNSWSLFPLFPALRSCCCKISVVEWRTPFIFSIVLTTNVIIHIRIFSQFRADLCQIRTFRSNKKYRGQDTKVSGLEKWHGLRTVGRFGSNCLSRVHGYNDIW